MATPAPECSHFPTQEDQTRARTQACARPPASVWRRFGPRVTVPLENPKLLDGVLTPTGYVFAILDPLNSRLLPVGPGWERELAESTTALSRVRLAFNGVQLALTWQAGPRLMFALFDQEGALQHQRQLTSTTQADEAVVGFAGGTWVPVWTHGLSTIVDAWATRIFPDGGDQTLAQKVTSQSLPLSIPASGVSALVNDAGIRALVLAESSFIPGGHRFLLLASARGLAARKPWPWRAGRPR